MSTEITYRWENRLFWRHIIAALSVLLLLFGCFAFTGADEEPPESCDLMVFISHPGDEVTFFSGLLATYAGEYGYSTRVIYLTCGSEELRTRSTEALKMLGVTLAPEYLDFPAAYFDTYSHALNSIKNNTLPGLFVELIRKYKPTIVVTHEIDGEYGHGMHTLCAKKVVEAVGQSGNVKRLVKSAKKYGAHTVSRLWLHGLNAEGALTIDRCVPLAFAEGKTALELDNELYAGYAEGQKYTVNIDNNVYTQPYYVLYGTEVEKLSSLFDGLDVPTAGAVKPAQTASSTVLSEEMKDSITASDSAGMSSASSANKFCSSVFLDPGEAEKVVFDEENGHYEYQSQNFSVFIDRTNSKTSQKDPVAYCIAHLYMRNENPFQPGIRESSKREALWHMARRYDAVIGVTGDNMIVDEREKKGIIIRDGKVYNDRAAEDTLAILPDGSITIYAAGEYKAQELLDRGILNTFSFGPTLIHNGFINHEIVHSRVEGKNPRVAVGMVEPGHLMLICVDGRQSNYSRGMTIETLATLLWAEGCTEAYNLDGGRSAAMVFMGEHINHHSGNGSDVQRLLPDALLWGKSDLVPAPEDPVYNISYGRRETPYR
ncbi:MAG: phosphodiester glycosidase family protein [Clostridiales bacterium]|nr:phosphodiester glycosidase family protein [Clostridiales bacterium]